MIACIVCDSQVSRDDALCDSLLRCPGCGLVFADACLSEDEHRALYRRDYFFGTEYANYLTSKTALQRNFRKRIDTLSQFSGGGRLYEIGSAYGFFLELAQARWQVEGIDIAPEACAYARDQLGLPVVCGDFLRASLASNAYDLFCMWDTVEHLREPGRYVARIAHHLRSGGYLALTTGDIGSWSARLQGRRWRLIHPPTHLYYFSAQTMKRFLERYGFEVVHISHPGFYRSLDEVGRWFLSHLGRRGVDLYHKSRDAGWMQMAIYLNLFDIMFVVARRR